MELPKRPKGDVNTKPGAYTELRRRLRTATAGLNVPTVVSYAFDKRTRILPYIFTSHRMAPAGPRAVGGALFDSGLTNTRVVFRQWNPNFRPSRARINGDPIEMLLVSSMQIHAENVYQMIADAHSTRTERGLLIIAGGPKAIYEPWDLFGIGGDPKISADVVVTGEEFVLMEMVEVLLQHRSKHGTMLEAFREARRCGALAGIPGLVYRRDDSVEAPLVTTGIQRLVEDLDEMPHPSIGFKLLERPHRGRDLKMHPLQPSRVGWHSPIGSLTMTHGCKFNCDYCPIPAYNQRTYRHKSGERIVSEMRELREKFNIGFFFGTDDNFFNDRDSTADLFRTMSRATIAGKPMRTAIHWGTEATEFDTWKNRDLLAAGRKSGLQAIWLGIEDLTATLIRKGQSVSKTAELFELMRRTGISPMPMMMHHDGQPLYTRNGIYGLLNQVNFLRKAGAQSLQVTVLTPAVGTRSYEANFEKQLVFESVGGSPVLQYQFDGNHVVASSLPKPWRTQLNLLMAYGLFYNPVNLARKMISPGSLMSWTAALDQIRGMGGLVKTAIHSTWWACRVAKGPIKRKTAPPGPDAPLIEVAPLAEKATAVPTNGTAKRSTPRVVSKSLPLLSVSADGTQQAKPVVLTSKKT